MLALATALSIQRVDSLAVGLGKKVHFGMGGMASMECQSPANCTSISTSLW